MEEKGNNTRKEKRNITGIGKKKQYMKGKIY